VLHDLLSRDRASLIHPLHDPAVQRAGRVWVRGDGAMLIDADGKEYIDGLAGLWNVVLGHGRRELAEAAREQMERLGYASGYAGSSNPRAIELAERLGQLTYPNINRFFFTSGGAEANETAKKSRARTGGCAAGLPRRRSSHASSVTTARRSRQ
jgi:putrescine---pyruvate transaminase